MKKSKAYGDHGTGVGRFCKLARAYDEEFTVCNDMRIEEHAADRCDMDHAFMLSTK